MAPTIPVWKTVGEAFATTFGDLKGVFLLAWLPFLIAYGFGFIAGLLREPLAISPHWLLVCLLLIESVMGSYFAVAMHRRRLFGDTPATRRVQFRLGAAERLFLAIAVGYWFVYGVLMTLSFTDEFQPSMLTGAFAIAGLIAAPFAAGAALILPAAAQGQPHPVQVGWHLGQGMRWRLIGLLLLTALPLSILASVIPQSGAGGTHAGALIVSLLKYPLTAVTIAALCIAYKTRTAGLEQAAEPTEAPAA